MDTNCMTLTRFILAEQKKYAPGGTGKQRNQIAFYSATPFSRSLRFESCSLSVLSTYLYAIIMIYLNICFTILEKY